jgi:hypothetical protein
MWEWDSHFRNLKDQARQPLREAFGKSESEIQFDPPVKGYYSGVSKGWTASMQQLLESLLIISVNQTD